MDSRYDYQQHEISAAKKWEVAQAFNPDSYPENKGKKPFTIIMPPPNANDALHVGHAMFVSLEDIMIRFHRMLGDDTVWIPGTDHAGIETQFLFEKKLKKDGKSRFQFDRETLYQMIWDYVQENSDVAVNQLKRIGASADWSRFRFTLDPQVLDVVLDTFKKLHDESLVYRDTRLVNYCPKCGTAFSDLEVNHQERIDPLFYLSYGPFVIATVRIETKFRDTALAVNPNDPRYKKYIGQTLEIPGLLGPIKMTVIADEEVDPDFGTGIMKVTPAHDPHDFELGKKYNLPVTPIIDFAGKMDFSWYIDSHKKPTTPDEVKWLERAQKYHGVKVEQVRKLMREDLEKDGLINKIDEKYIHTVGTCYRCGSVLEPLPLPQFFIKVAPLVKPVLASLKKGDITVLGAGHDKILKHWLENLKDWNISRQIVWGIRLPIWYDVSQNPSLEVSFIGENHTLHRGTVSDLLEKGFTLEAIKSGLQSLRAPLDSKYIVSLTTPGENFLQETDTFDTWFSSGQWPFATLKSLSQADFDRFYPTSVMETGYDILPFWVMRMLMLGYFSTGKSPFSHVYLHGLVRDQKGQKMSKSKGNVINPLTVIDTYGADALRMALVIRSSAGLDKSVGDADFKAMRNFTNKIWNAARFIKTKLDEQPALREAKIELDEESSPEIQSWLKRTDLLVEQITTNLHDFKLGLAADTLYNEFWHWFCDEAIENAKQESDPELQSRKFLALSSTLFVFLKLFHPFMPFITETLWSEFHPHQEEGQLTGLLVAQPWPNKAK